MVNHASKINHDAKLIDKVTRGWSEMKALCSFECNGDQPTQDSEVDIHSFSLFNSVLITYPSSVELVSIESILIAFDLIYSGTPFERPP